MNRVRDGSVTILGLSQLRMCPPTSGVDSPAEGGRALAVALHERGNTVILGGRRRDRLDELTAAHPGLDAVVIDTADPESIRKAVAEVLDRRPDLDVLVAMAGIMKAEDRRTPEGFLSSAEDVVTTNVLGPIRLIAALVEHLRGRPGAAILTVSSGPAFTPLAVTPSYTSKAAVRALTESLRLQLADTSIAVREIVPPAVRPLMPGHEDNEAGMPLDEYVAETMALLEGGDREILVERVKPLRHSEVRGEYEQTVALLSGGH
ncbi:SDR family NAD(P)-dependent oxidoreductase [Pseudonocardia sp. NPDC046786]|uniref:SDR family oxidoreductase n=1 Tax=Pseudonocardia sp. NPDC046786 TaxID=3155471 RepID=UPI0033EE985B